LFAPVLALVGGVFGSGQYCIRLRAIGLRRSSGMTLFGKGLRMKRPGLFGSGRVVSGS
jgi:hypothetical protein